MNFAAIRSLAAALFLLLPCAAPAQEDPEAVYGKFHRALLAGNIAEMNKYGTPGGGADLARMPEGQRQGILDLMKKLLPRNYSITGKSLNPDGKRLTMRGTGTGALLFSGKSAPQAGVITMLKLDGEWKVDEANWGNAGSPAKAQQRAAPALETPVAKAKPKPSAAPPPPTPDRKLGTAKPTCVFKPVMTAEDVENCK